MSNSNNILEAIEDRIREIEVVCRNLRKTMEEAQENLAIAESKQSDYRAALSIISELEGKPYFPAESRRPATPDLVWRDGDVFPVFHRQGTLPDRIARWIIQQGDVRKAWTVTKIVDGLNEEDGDECKATMNNVRTALYRHSEKSRTHPKLFVRSGRASYRVSQFVIMKLEESSRRQESVRRRGLIGQRIGA
tara:strand:+ start:209 stop:784 length:576 start_codon:yes stop_codon:yes gene_type:complete